MPGEISFKVESRLNRIAPNGDMVVRGGSDPDKFGSPGAENCHHKSAQRNRWRGLQRHAFGHGRHSVLHLERPFGLIAFRAYASGIDGRDFGDSDGERSVTL